MAGSIGARAGAAGTAFNWEQVGYRPSKAEGTTNEALTDRFVDEKVPHAADSLRYRLRQVDTGGSSTLTAPIPVGRGKPGGPELLGTAPIRPEAMWLCGTSSSKHRPEMTVRLGLNDGLGREGRTVTLNGSDAEGGRHRRILQVRGLASGVYLLRLIAGSRSVTRKLTVVK